MYFIVKDNNLLFKFKNKVVGIQNNDLLCFEVREHRCCLFGIWSLGTCFSRVLEIYRMPNMERFRRAERTKKGGRAIVIPLLPDETTEDIHTFYPEEVLEIIKHYWSQYGEITYPLY